MSAVTDINADLLQLYLDRLNPNEIKKDKGQAIMQEGILMSESIPEPDFTQNKADKRRYKEAE